MAGNRGPKISKDIMVLICDKALKSSKRRTKLAEELEEIIQNKGWRSPTIETMEKLISKARNHKNEQDKPWSIASLDTYSIPPEALPAVLAEYARHKLKEDDTIANTDFTIRQAKWVARLSKIDRLSKTKAGRNASYYIAKTEQIYEYLGWEPELELYDKLLAGLMGESDHWEIPFIAEMSVWGILKNDPTKKKKGG
jgi:hypothetical protein